MLNWEGDIRAYGCRYSRFGTSLSPSLVGSSQQVGSLWFIQLATQRNQLRSRCWIAWQLRTPTLGSWGWSGLRYDEDGWNAKELGLGNCWVVKWRSAIGRTYDWAALRSRIMMSELLHRDFVRWRGAWCWTESVSTIELAFSRRMMSND
jgi:hypothetical protein